LTKKRKEKKKKRSQKFLRKVKEQRKDPKRNGKKEAQPHRPRPERCSQRYSLFACPLTRKLKARKVSKMNTSSHTPKQASKQAKETFLKKKRLWDKTGSRGEEERNEC